MKYITLSHGNGGEETDRLINDIFFKYLDNRYLSQKNDGTNLGKINGQVIMTTDSFVINPIFFNGGNIGKISVCGTINDLAVMGAKPLYLSLALILEEGLEIEVLEKIIYSISEEAKKANVYIVCGDTKVVGKGQCDKIYINTTGIGVLDECNKPKGINFIEVGDKIIISGTIGDHGCAILNERNEFIHKEYLKSDCQSLNFLISEVLSKVGGIKVMRDPTRGGLATTLNELVKQSNLSMEIYEENIPYKDEVKDFCSLLGLDPLYMANEGKVIFIVKNDVSEEILRLLKNTEIGKDSAIIGEVISDSEMNLYLTTSLGIKTILYPITGEELPRIC